MINYFRIGYIITTHGIKGELKCINTSDDLHRYDDVKSIYLVPKNELSFNISGINKDKYIYTVENVKYIKNSVIIKCKKIDTIEEAKRYVGYDIYIDRQDAKKLKNNEYYIPDLIGLKLVDQNNKELAEVIDVIDNMSQAKLIVKKDNKEYIIPMVSEFIKKIDLNNKIIEVLLVEGLLDDI